METLREWGVIAAASLNDLMTALAALLPRLLGAIVLFLLGWLLARLLRGLTRRLLGMLDRILQRFPFTSTPEFKRLSQTSKALVSGFVFWLVIIIFIAASTSVLHLEIFTRWFDEFLVYLPKLLAGAVIIISGMILGSAVRPLIAHAASRARFHQSELLARIVQISIVITAFVVGVEQIGIDVSFLTDLAIVAFAVVFAAFSLGIALATPGHINNLISAYNIRRNYQEGDEILIGEHHGRIMAITQSSVIIETAQGETTLPAKLFTELAVTKLISQESKESGHE